MIRTFVRLGILVLAFGPASCGKAGSSGSSPAGGGGSPVVFQVISITPFDGAIGVERPPVISATFSKSVLSASVTPLTFTLESAQGPVSCSFSVVGTAATLYPLEPMPPSSWYTVTLSKQVKDLTGAQLGTDRIWMFKTRGLRWSWPQSLDVTGQDVQDHDVAINAAGQSVVAWTEGDGVRSTYAAIHMSFEEGWSSPLRLDEGDIVSDLTPKVGMDGSGDSTVVWYDQEGFGRLRGRRHLASGGWQQVETLDDGASTAAPRLRIQVAPDGQAYVSYMAVSPNPFAIPPMSYWLGYTPGSGWQPRVPGAPLPYADEDNCDAVMNEAGQMAALFAAATTPMETLYAKMFDGDWDQQVGIPFNEMPDRPRAAIDEDGVLLAVWRRESDDTLVSARYSSALGWNVFATLQPDGPLEDPHSLAGDAAGNALLIWTESIGGVSRLRHARYQASSQNWGVEFSDPVQSGAVSGAQLKMTSTGIAFAAWAELINNRWVVRCSQYIDGSGWSSPVTVGSDLNLDCFFPRLAVSSNGTATVAYLRGNAAPFDLMVSRFE